VEPIRDLAFLRLWMALLAQAEETFALPSEKTPEFQHMSQFCCCLPLNEQITSARGARIKVVDFSCSQTAYIRRSSVLAPFRTFRRAHPPHWFVRATALFSKRG